MTEPTHITLHEPTLRAICDGVLNVVQPLIRDAASYAHVLAALNSATAAIINQFGAPTDEDGEFAVAHAQKAIAELYRTLRHPQGASTQ